MPLPRALALTLAALLVGSGCERLGIPDPARLAAAKEAESKAVGAGCRHGGRSLEDCYTLNLQADKSAVFAGWKEMNDYMLANKLEDVPAKLPPPPPPAAPKSNEDGAAGEEEKATSEHGADEEASAEKPAGARAPEGKAAAAEESKKH